MKKIGILTLLAVLLLQSNAVLAQGEAALIKAVKAKLDKVANYQASGSMTIDAAFIKAPPSNITAYYKKPDRFAVKKGDGLSILPKGGVSINLASLLGGENVTAVSAGNSVVKGIPVKIIKLLPLDESGDVVLSTLYINEKAQLVQKAQVTTRNNGSYEMDLQYGKYATWGLPDKVVFTFNTKEYKLPKGIAMEYDKGNSAKTASPKDRKGIVSINYTNYIINKGVDDKVFGK
jgi:hypothetical protein